MVQMYQSALLEGFSNFGFIVSFYNKLTFNVVILVNKTTLIKGRELHNQLGNLEFTFYFPFYFQEKTSIEGSLFIYSR